MHASNAMRGRKSARPYSARKILHRAIALGFTLVVSACSTTDYSKPITDFAIATGRAQVALSDLNAQVTEGYRQVLEKKIVGKELTLRAAQDNCLVTSERCRLEALDKSGKSIGRYPPDPPLQKMSLVIAEINAYANNLKALVEANTAAKVESQVNAALASVQKLAETVGGPAHTVPQFATPVGQALNWLIGQYVERVKLKGLQHATNDAKPVVQAAAKLFAAVSVFAGDSAKADFAAEFRTANDAFQTSRNEPSLVSLVQAASKYDSLLATAPPNLFAHMMNAHDALADDLENKGASFVTVLARIEAFATEASKVAKILEDLRAVITDKKGK